MVVDAIPGHSLQDSLTQLARSFQAHEATTFVSQIAECLEKLPSSDRSALERLFSLLSRNTITTAIDGSVGIPVASAWPERRHSPTVSAQLSGKRKRTLVNASSGHTHESLGNISASTHDDLSATLPGLQASSSPLSRLLAGVDPSGLACAAVSGVQPHGGPDSAVAISDSGHYTRPSATNAAHASEPGSLKFSATTETLLQACMQDPSAFLRAVEDGKVSLPNGQGWEAAIATKRNNADLRELTRIFHRFECYNIYRHVVNAGYHTGSHWVRDMRPMLATKLSHDFPSSFVDQKAANKCLNWVDQGCRYREWAERLSDAELELGYLIALPCDVPHSTYTSRCTREHMANTIVELKELEIDKVVERMKLSVLANHIVNSLHEMTTTASHGSTSHGQRVSTSAARSTCAPARSEPTIFDVDHYAFDAFADSWLEDTWFMDEMTDSAIQPHVATNASSCLPASSIPSCADFNLSNLPSRVSGSHTTLADVF